MQVNTNGRSIMLAIAMVCAASAHAESYKFVRQWGAHGSGPGQLNWPTALAVDRRGHIYVTELDNDRVQRFYTDGTFLSMWGGSGSGVGQFDRPQGVAVDTSGNVYVTDWGSNRIEKFRPEGQFIGQWGSFGLEPGYFQHPSGIAADTVGNIYVADHPDDTLLRAGSDPLLDRVQKFTNAGGFQTQWGGTGSEPGEFLQPTGVAVDRSGNVYVCDYMNNRIQKFSATGTFITQWGSTGTGSGHFRGPAAVAVDRTGNVFVADYQNNRVQKFTSTGTFITQWGGTGSAPGEFGGPDAIAVDDSGYVYVAETGNDRIQVFSPSPHVLLVHGICGSASAWDTFVPILRDSGYIVHTMQYGSTTYSAPPDTFVAVLAAELDAINSDHVLIVAHSMGGLVARAFMERERLSGRPNPIAQIVTLGTPHHGSDLAARILRTGTQLDLGCALAFPGAPCDVAANLKEIFGCQGDRRSALALRDMTPGSGFLNQLNYGGQAGLYDPPFANGWDSHYAETLVPRTYHATIAGTQSSCLFSYVFTWDFGDNYHPNDGAVATGSAFLTNSQAFQAYDVELPTRPLTHASLFPLLCGLPYYSLDTLGRKVATILQTEPAAPPVVGLRRIPGGLPVVSAVAGESLRTTPAIVDTIAPGMLDLPTRAIPATTLMLATLVSEDARLTLRAPNGTIITPNDTSTANSIVYFGQAGSGFEGYRITHPMAGTWTFRVDATSSLASQSYGCLVEYASTAETRLSTRLPVIYGGDSIRVRSEVVIADSRQTGVGWTCLLLGPNNATSTLTLFDDGAHGDSLSGDGIYGNVAPATDGFGLYRVGATATLAGGESFATVGNCELAHYDDLSVPSDKIWFAPNMFNAGDSVTVHATIRNIGSRSATDVTVAIQDRRIGQLLGTNTLSIAAGGEVEVQMPWKTSAPDTHEIEVSVRPYVFESEASYANNAAQRTVILGTPVGVDPHRLFPGYLWLSQPRPNPSKGVVSFTFELPGRGPAALEVFDVLGRRIRRWVWRDLAAGSHTIEWNGLLENGSVAAPGLLVCRLSAAGEVRSRKLVFRP